MSKTHLAAPIPRGYRCSVELRILRYFVAVAEELHFGRAATRLHMSQPPLSRAIKQLEADIGALLFARSPTGVTLTPVGTVLLDEARALLDHADRVRVRVREAVEAARPSPSASWATEPTRECPGWPPPTAGTIPASTSASATPT